MTTQQRWADPLDAGVSHGMAGIAAHGTGAGSAVHGKSASAEQPAGFKNNEGRVARSYGTFVGLTGAGVIEHAIYALRPEGLRSLVRQYSGLGVLPHTTLAIKCGCGQQHDYATPADIPETDTVCPCGQKLITYGLPPAVVVNWW